jgi:hypothetical protein
MKHLLIILSIVTHTGCAQDQSGWNKIEIDSNSKYEVRNEDKIEKRNFFNEPDDTVRASLIVDNNPLNAIKFSKAELKGDTLKILLYETNEAYHHEYLLSIIKNRYSLKYIFLVSGFDDDGEMIVLESKLKLNTFDFTKGQQIRGYTEFKGKCAKPCNQDFITLKGNFKAIIN